ncbi:MAG: beta-ketoacyl synthase chain length factor [Desulfobacteraceae bacterium]|jgi:3-oxoacyl-[acyl-carrier-protein] synthase II|nr:beta-ketoacyl synthase chain length factor [Desulfobacteraceae bacterium]
MRTAIAGLGVVGGFGYGNEKLSRVLISGKCTPKMLPLTTKNQTAELPVYICDTSPLETFINKRALRRVDHFSKLAALGSFLALEDAGVLQDDHQKLAIVVATGYGASRTTFSFLDTAFDDGDACASPTLFSNSVHNAAAAHVSILLKAKGPNLTVSQFEMSVPSAMMTACQWLEDKVVDAVLFGGVDEYCSVLGYCWQRFFGPDPAARMKPLEWGDQSAIIGEGSAFFLLTRDEGDKPKYGFITDIQIGHVRKYKPQSPEDACLFLGADGQKSSAIHYAQHIPHGTHSAVYTPLYGSFPAGFAFDMAIAGLSIQERTIYATPEHAGNNSGLKIFWDEQRLASEQICCLKFSCKGEFAMITMSVT